MSAALPVPHKPRLPLDRLSRQAARPAGSWDADGAVSIDFGRWFVCPTATPLYYTPVYGELSEAHARRYSQLMGMLNNELICFFETALAANVLTALSRPGRRGGSAELTACLSRFMEDEVRHTRMFRRLNRLSAPQWYGHEGEGDSGGRDHHLMVVPRPVYAALDFITRRPLAFPMILWVMLVMEERSLMLSRRYAKLPPAWVEPHYAAVYKVHLEDEVRHVQIDWHLLERFYTRCTSAVRRANAALFRTFIVGFFLTPARSNVRVVTQLSDEFPELRPLLPRMCRELRDLPRNPAYRAMMYSEATTPITFGLFNHFPELAPLRHELAGPGNATDPGRSRR